jgi:hypothetical protein
VRAIASYIGKGSLRQADQLFVRRLEVRVGKVDSIGHDDILASPGPERSEAKMFAHSELRELIARVQHRRGQLSPAAKVLWQVGLDDALVECCKARLMASDLTLAAPGSQLTVDGIDVNEDLLLDWWPEIGADVPSRRVTIPGRWLLEADRDRETLRSRYPGLFGSGLVSLHRLLDAHPIEESFQAGNVGATSATFVVK